MCMIAIVILKHYKNYKNNHVNERLTPENETLRWNVPMFLHFSFLIKLIFHIHMYDDIFAVILVLGILFHYIQYIRKVIKIDVNDKLISYLLEQITNNN